MSADALTNKKKPSFSRPKDLMKRIFSRKAKIKINKIDRTKTPMTNTGDCTCPSESMNSSSYSENLQHSKSKAPLASVESSSTCKLNSDEVIGGVNSSTDITVPVIREEPASSRNSPIPSVSYNKEENVNVNVQTLAVNDLCLLSPNQDNDDDDRKRKLSDNDSAVDLKFQDDSSEQDRLANYSEVESNSRCPSNHGASLDESQSSIDTKVLKRTESTSWRKIRMALIWTPFIQKCAKHQYPWVQIAGHQGNFKPGEQGTILKKHCARESICLQMMREDILKDFVPEFKSEMDYEGEKYICMEDLLCNFDQPSLMDIKMGCRTYLEEELVKAKKCPKPRPDMYEKMITVDENEPTEEEHKLKAVLKPRYMVWRESLSSSVTLCFRIEGIKKASISNESKVVGTQSRSFKKTKHRCEVKEALVDFLDCNTHITSIFLERLKSLRSTLEKSQFFYEHEFIGSSLLFVYDKHQKASVWMIDFGKTVPIPPKIRINHLSKWKEGNHEDGYLMGLDNLMSLLSEIVQERCK